MRINDDKISHVLFKITLFYTLQLIIHLKIIKHMIRLISFTFIFFILQKLQELF